MGLSGSVYPGEGAILMAVGSAVRGGLNVQGAPLVLKGRGVVGHFVGTGNVRASI